MRSGTFRVPAASPRPLLQDVDGYRRRGICHIAIPLSVWLVAYLQGAISAGLARPWSARFTPWAPFGPVIENRLHGLGVAGAFESRHQLRIRAVRGGSHGDHADTFVLFTEEA